MPRGGATTHENVGATLRRAMGLSRTLERRWRQAAPTLPSASDRGRYHWIEGDIGVRISARSRINPGLRRLVLVVLWPSMAAGQQSVPELLQSGNQLYSQGNYKEAIEQFEKIVQRPFANEVVYYNLANACFKDNQLGRAILYYEKAIRLAPGDREISENLTFARTRIADKVEKPAEGFLIGRLRGLVNSIPLDLETSLVVVFFILANASFSLFWLNPFPAFSRLTLYASATFLAIFLLLGASNVFRIYVFETTREGVVLVEKADVLSGPGSDNPVLFSIHEGLKVRVENEIQGWVQVSLENGWNGWLKKESLGIV